ncbi:MAG: bifunctional folylpolyglutamate synthase/dihydrofolate synthase [Fimbriiglobus sp.]
MTFLTRLANYEQKPPAAADLALEPIRHLLSHLGNPQDQLRIVHITGSKGKGSVAAMLEAVARAAGYRTGLYTSPPMMDFEERVRLNGQPVTQELVARGLSRVADAYDAVLAAFPDRQPPTFFDAVTALAFLLLAEAKVELAIIEVGMGGRTDSTNVLSPLVSVIVSVSLDHMAQLGPTTAHIAEHKAGIIKPGRPVVSGVTDPAARAIIEAVALSQGSELQEIHRDFTVRSSPPREEADGFLSHFAVMLREVWSPLFALRLLGEHQTANAAVVYATLKQLEREGFSFSEHALQTGFREVSWPGRMELLGREPMLILDCAHNPASADAFLRTVRQLRPDFQASKKRAILIFACSRDKDVRGILEILVPQFTHILGTRYSTSQRCATLEDLTTAMASINHRSQVELIADPRQALARARELAQPEDVICITGSIFLAGEMRPWLLEDSKSMTSSHPSA